MTFFQKPIFNLKQINNTKNKAIAIIFLFVPIFSFSQILTIQSSGTVQALSGVHFFSATDGVACGQNVILTTNDGGQNWLFKQHLALWADVFMTSANTFYTVARNGLVYKTVNGGTSFTTLPTNITEHLGSVFFITPQIGWVSGQSGTILKTTDAGQTWSPQVTNTQSFLHQIYFIDQNNGWAVGAKEVVLTTNNGGNTWTPQIASVNGLYTYLDIHFLNANEGWLVGSNGFYNSLFKTTNGGANWNQITYGINKPQMEVQFLNFNLGFSCFNSAGDSTLRMSINGGNTWTSFPFFGINLPLISIHFPNPSVGFAVGERGQIVKIATTSGIENSKNVSSLDLYPNPVNNFLTINLPNNFIGTPLIKIYHVSGKLIEDIIINTTFEHKTEINTENLKNGVYFIQLASNGKNYVQKIIIHH